MQLQGNYSNLNDPSFFNFSHALLTFNIQPASGKSVTITIWLHTVMKQLQL